jgi:hypothetical protein
MQSGSFIATNVKGNLKSKGLSPKLKIAFCPLSKLIAGKYALLGPLGTFVNATPRNLLLRQKEISPFFKSINVPMTSPVLHCSPYSEEDPFHFLTLLPSKA